MSRGPGRMMRAALAELAGYSNVTAYGAARRAAHDVRCGCDCPGECTSGNAWIGWQPSRAEMVSARRALHTLADRGDVELYRIRTYDVPPALAARPVSVAKSGCIRPRQHIDDSADQIPCASCLRPSGHGGGQPGRMVLCGECAAGVTDGIALVSGGQYAPGWGPVVPCADCGGELSEYGYRRLYVDGATLPLCDPCSHERSRASLRRRGVDIDALSQAAP